MNVGVNYAQRGKIKIRLPAVRRSILRGPIGKFWIGRLGYCEFGEDNFNRTSVQQRKLHTGPFQAKLQAVSVFDIRTQRKDTIGGFGNFAKINHRDFLSG